MPRLQDLPAAERPDHAAQAGARSAAAVGDGQRSMLRAKAPRPLPSVREAWHDGIGEDPPRRYPAEIFVIGAIVVISVVNALLHLLA